MTDHQTTPRRCTPEELASCGEFAAHDAIAAMQVGDMVKARGYLREALAHLEQLKDSTDA